MFKLAPDRACAKCSAAKLTSTGRLLRRESKAYSYCPPDIATAAVCKAWQKTSCETRSRGCGRSSRPIIIDAAPVLTVADALSFGPYVDGAIVAVRRDVSQIPKVYEGCERLRSVGIHVIGGVINGVHDRPTRSAYAMSPPEIAATQDAG